MKGDNNKKQTLVVDNKPLLNCCDQTMVLEETHEEKENKVCLKYTCSKCKKSIFSLESKRPKAITLNLTVVQYESLMSSVGNVLQIIHETKRENY